MMPYADDDDAYLPMMMLLRRYARCCQHAFDAADIDDEALMRAFDDSALFSMPMLL